MSDTSLARRCAAALCAVFLLLAATAPAQAALVGTDRVIAEASAEVDRARVIDMLDRDAVQQRLQAMGVDPADAKARVERMTDAEVARLQGRIDEMAAGGDAVGVLLTIFIVFVITDVIGATDIFPFIQPVD